MRRGFSTLEIMLALAIFSIVLAGAIIAHFSAQYWTIVSQTSGEAFSLAHQQIEDVRAEARHDFVSAVSTTSTSCLGALCYSVSTSVSDISPCAKNVTSSVSWQVAHYPSASISLPTIFTSTSSAIALGGDCSLSYPGDWTTPSTPVATTTVNTPTGIDALNGTIYSSESSSPYLEAITPSGVHYAYTAPDNTKLLEPAYAIDVARDLTTGKVYAYLATGPTNISIVDVTNPSAMAFVASTTFSSTSGTNTSGRSIAYFKGNVYVTTDARNNRIGRDPVLYVFDVTNPASPQEVGSISGANLNTSIYGLAIQKKFVGGAPTTLAFLATTLGTGQLQVFDVTSPQSIGTPLARCSVSGGLPSTSLSLLGNDVFIGLQTQTTDSSPAIAVFDVNNVLPPISSCAPIAAASAKAVSCDKSNSQKTRYPYALFATGSYLFALTDNTTPNLGELQVWRTDVSNADASKRLSFQKEYPDSCAGPAMSAIDFDSDANSLYIMAPTGAQIFTGN
ncbi:type II secretion system protein [Candidatus Kaiserbacteria bacterium]|nr:type II secretion system protein [Candidatus Kaiserbacteria bacterium]